MWAMGNPEPTMRRTQELKTFRDAVQSELVSMPGFTSCGIGLAPGVMNRPGLTPETVQPEDLVINITFSSAEYLERARATISRLLPGVPLELGVRGVLRAL
jgi:hypothetical protein